MMIWLVPYIITVIVLSSFSIDYHPYYPNSDEKAKGTILRDKYYDDIRLKYDDDIINRASIPSKYVTNGFVELFLAYKSRRYNESMQAICPDFEPIREIGLNHSFVIGFSNGAKGEKTETYAADTALLCLQQLYQIRIEDSLYQNLSYRFYEHPAHGELGMLTVIDIQHLERGEHTLQIEYQDVKSDTLIWRDLCDIPFWKE